MIELVSRNNYASQMDNYEPIKVEFDVFLHTEEKISCKFCNYSVDKFNKHTSYKLLKHSNSFEHKNSVDIELKRINNLIRGENDSLLFHKNLVKWVNRSNISYDVLDNLETKEFFRSMGKHIKSAEHYRTKINDILLEEQFNAFYEVFVNYPFAVYFDESSYKGHVQQLNMYVQVLKPDEYIKLQLVACLEVVDTKTNTLLPAIYNVFDSILDFKRNKKIQIFSYRCSTIVYFYRKSD